MIKKIAIICALTLMLTIVGCGQTGKESAESVGQLLSQELSGEITVSAYDTMMYKNTLETAAKSFEAEHPGTKINIETYASMPEIKTSENGGTRIALMEKEDDSQDKAEYINKVNTELMSGEGADILAMDILPYYKYADKGQLEDLQEYMNADSSFHLEDYRENIINALKYNDGQYVLPMDYMFDYIAYDSSLFTDEEQQNLKNGDTYTYAQLIEAAEGPFERANTGSAAPERMFGAPAYSSQQESIFKEMMLQDFDSFIDMENKSVNLTDGRFAELLEALKAYSDNGYLTPNADSSERKEISAEDFKKTKEEQFFYKIKSNFSFLTEALKEAGLNIMMSFGGMSAGNEDNDKTLGLPANENGDVNFTYSQAYGINANSDNKALAWAFIKYLMSEEMQAGLGTAKSGLPVNNAARLEKAKMDITGASFDKSRMNGFLNQKGEQNTKDAGLAGEQNTKDAGLAGEQNTKDARSAESKQPELTETQQAALDKYMKTIEGFSDLLNRSPIQDDTVNTMISEELARYFDGSKTAVETAETLQEKIELYLNE